MDEGSYRGAAGNMIRILDFLQNITIGPAERYRRATAAPHSNKDVVDTLFRMCTAATLKLYRCRDILREIRDLEDSPITIELRMEMEECLIELEKEDELCL